MLPDYSSVWAKLGRAEELLNRLNFEVDRWHQFVPYSFVNKRDDEHRCFQVIVHIDRQPDITRWSLMFADIIHNLRCALDHLIWAIVVYEHPNGPPKEADRIEFPLWANSPKANSNTKRRLEVCLSATVRAAVEFVQPCNRSNRSFIPNHPLLYLADTDNRNKHRLLHLAFTSFASGNWRLEYVKHHQGDLPIMETCTGEIKDGTPVMTATFSIPHPEMKHDYRLSLIIGFHYGVATKKGADRDDYCALAELLIREVEDVIDTVIAVVK